MSISKERLRVKAIPMLDVTSMTFKCFKFQVPTTSKVLEYTPFVTGSKRKNPLYSQHIAVLSSFVATNGFDLEFGSYSIGFSIKSYQQWHVDA